MAINLGFAGVDLSMLPANWWRYDSQRDAAWRAAKPTQALIARYPEVTSTLVRTAAAEGRALADLRFLPLVSRQVSWVVLLAPPDAHVAGYLPVDGFL
jgi:hypothetical protein